MCSCDNLFDMLIGISDACLHCQHLFIGLLFYEREGNPEYLARTANRSGRISKKYDNGLYRHWIIEHVTI